MSLVAGPSSVQAAGIVTAPGANGAISAVLTPAFNGPVQVDVYTSGGGAALAAADVGNMILKRNGVDVGAKLPVALVPTKTTFLLNGVSADTFQVFSVGAGTAGVVYNATIVVSPLVNS